MLLGVPQLAVKMTALIHDQRVVRNGLLGPALVLRQITAARFRFDVQETRRAVIRHDGLATVVQNPAQLVEMSVAHSLRGVLHYEHLRRTGGWRAQDRERTLVAPRPVAK